MEGVKYLTEEDQVKVAADFKAMSDCRLKESIIAFEELPTCLRLAKEELERRESK